MVISVRRPRYLGVHSGFNGPPLTARRFSSILAIVAALCFSSAISTSAELSRPSEYELKATFLYNFKFTGWPPEQVAKSTDPFVIGVLGKDPFGSGLDRVIEGETVNDKTVVFRRFAKTEQAANTQVLFIASSEEHNLPAILRALEGKSILTVSEIENFAQRGGIINLKKENNRVVFEINLDTAKRAGLTMNAQLLKLARVVKDQP
jgi:hypothetical protein